MVEINDTVEVTQHSARHAIAVTHVINGLGVGGAETVLYRLLTGPGRAGFRDSVISLRSVGDIGLRLRDAGISVECLNLASPAAGALGLVRLRRLLAANRPDVIQSWMYHADLLAGIAGIGLAPVLWGVHHTSLDKTKAMTRHVARACAAISRSVPHRIVCCAESTRDAHQALGYCARKLVVISNGFEVRASPICREEALRALQREFGVGTGAVFVCVPARFHPQKDHSNFFRAARIVVREAPNVHFLLCGKDIDAGNRQLANMAADVDVPGRIHLLGLRADVASLMKGSVTVISSSSGEGLPCALGESMALGTPCVATDTGDCRRLIGDTGVVVPSRDHLALAEGILKLLRLDRASLHSLGVRAQQRVERQFNIEQANHAYRNLYRRAVEQAHS